MDNKFSELSVYLRKQFLYLNYIHTTNSKDNHELKSWLALIIFTLVTLKTIWFTLLNHDDPILYYLGDATIEFGSIRTPMDLILAIWLTGSWYCGMFIKYSNLNGKYQLWVNDNDILIQRNEKSDKIVHLFLHQTQSNMITAFLLTVGINIPLLFQCPPGYYSLNIFYLLIHGFTGSLVSAYAINFGLFFALKMFFYAKKFSSLSAQLSHAKDEIASMHKKNAHANKFIKHLTSKLQEIVLSYYFWEQINQTLFIATFINQSLILYLIFCTPTRNDLKIALTCYGLLNCAAGQSLHFLLGNNAQKKIDETIKTLRQFNIKSMGNSTKLQILIFLEYVTEKKFFTIFGDLVYSSRHFTLVLIENAALLLLLIANLQTRKFFT